MVERLADLVAQIQNIRQLEAIITAMRGLAASRAQQARALRGGVTAYADTVWRAIGAAMSLRAPEAPAAPEREDGARARIIFCAEQGFVGGFSERILDAAGDVSDMVLLLIGARGAAAAAERGLAPDWTASLPASADAVAGLANLVAEKLYTLVAERGVTDVDMVFARAAPSGAVGIEQRSLLPIDYSRFAPARARQPPLANLAPEPLIEGLAAEYVFALLCEAAMLAFEAENQARMLAMASAKTNIERRLEALAQRERRVRQEQITTEILELAAGAAAVRGGAGSLQ